MICAVLVLCLWAVGSTLGGLRVPLQISGCVLLLTDTAPFSPRCCLIDLVSARLMLFFACPEQHVVLHGCARAHFIPSVLRC